MIPTFEGKDELIDQRLYDDLVTDWAKKTGWPLPANRHTGDQRYYSA